MTVHILVGDALERLRRMPADSAHCCVTSPPYWNLRDYGVPPSIWGGDPDCVHQFGEAITRSLRGGVGDKSTIDGDQSRSGSRMEQTDNGAFCRCGAWLGCLGLEPTPELFVEHMVAIFREVRRVIRPDGTLWLNIGDCYAASGGPGIQGKHGSCADRIACLNGIRENRRKTRPHCKPKDLVGIPWLLAFALRADGWYLRSEIFWHKPNPMPESVADRPTKSHEYVFLLAKSGRYFYDAEALAEPAATAGSPIKTADGWDTASGSHGTIHRAGREKGRKNGQVQAATRNRRSVWTIATQPFSGWTRTDHWVRVALDAVSDGTRRIASPDCLVHGRLDRLDGERAGDTASRSQHNDAHHEREQGIGRASSSTCHVPSSQESSSDSPDQTCGQPAKRHSRQTRKTDLAPSTSSSCTASAQNASGIADIPESPGFSGSVERTPWSNTWPDELDDHLWEQTPYHTVSSSSLPISLECTCTFYHKVTKETSHFATFPPRLAETCILAGTSEAGCCAACGTPWERVTARTYANPGNRRTNGPRSAARKHLEHGSAGYGVRLEKRVATTGWRAGCRCDAGEPIPCTVLDPFGGAGTTGLVADRLGRDAVLVELSPDYAAMARRRIERDANLFAAVELECGEEIAEVAQ